MAKLVALDENGQKQQLLCLGEFASLPNIPEGWSLLPYDGPEEDISLVEVVLVEGTPSIQTRAPTLDELKLQARTKVNAIRDARINGRCPTSFGLVDLDDSSPRESRRKLNGAVTGAVVALQVGQPFSVIWTMADDQDVALSAAQVVEMGMTVLAYIDACHRRARELKFLIMAAVSAEQIEAININEGWPSLT